MAPKIRLRTEHDTLGEVSLPADAWYGAQTARAAVNFPISGLTAPRVFIAATGMVKKAACLANASLGALDIKLAQAIELAADDVISGELDAEFIVDAFQAGAGTSHNMNANEVIANRAEVILGGRRGRYELVHPNDHVNMGQSTNDTFPTAMRVAHYLALAPLIGNLKKLQRTLSGKARSFDRVIKSGRTHLQDAVPVTLGGEFSSYASAVGGSVERIKAARERLKKIPLGATAAGTGLNTPAGYRARAARELSKASGIRGLRPAPDMHEAINSMADFTALSGSLKELAVELLRISNDLRLLGSGPRTGLGEIRLPAVQPGSSMMPGKVNPVMAEMLGMVCMQVIGADSTVTLAAQAGQLELNVMMPVVNHNILHAIDILANAVDVFTTRCVAGITADKRRCQELFESSVALVTVLNPVIGYEHAARVARESERTGRSVREVVISEGILTEAEWDRLMDPNTVTMPGLSSVKKKRR